MNHHYAEIQQVLAGERSLADASEAHGTLAGCLCAAVHYRFEDWLLEILPEGRAQPAATAALREVFTQTADALEAPDLTFELLLPADEQPIDTRATALAQWCQGFLYGLGSSAIQDTAALPGDVGEIVRYLAEITKAGVTEDGGEADEVAYSDLVQFVRMGVIQVFLDLSPLRDQRLARGPLLH